MSKLKSLAHKAIAPTAAIVLGVTLLSAPPAQGAARVSVSNQSGSLAIDPTYATTLTLRGNGFQSISKAHGGIYVMFGAVRGRWQPSQGGGSGQDYFTVPDTESANNSGYLKYVAFPGSDTARSANGGQLSDNGSWGTTLKVPGAVFKTYDRNGKVTTIDCRQDTCGVLTLGAHGVANANNETFTRVPVKSLYDAQRASAGDNQAARSRTGTSAPEATANAAGQQSEVASKRGVQAPVVLEVDRASARPGRVLAFSATGLIPGSQVSATFDDGRVGAGPLTVGSQGQVAGLLRLPADLKTGTYQLRLVGSGDLPAVRFGVMASAAEQSDWQSWAPVAFAVSGGLTLIAVFALLTIRRRRSSRDA